MFHVKHIKKNLKRDKEKENNLNIIKQTNTTITISSSLPLI